MTPLDQQQAAAAATASDRSALTQRLDVPQVDLPPEEPSLDLTQLVPELDLIGEKEKKDDSEEEEVREEPPGSSPVQPNPRTPWLLCIVCVLTGWLCCRMRRAREVTRTRRRRDGTRGPNRCSTGSR